MFLSLRNVGRIKEADIEIAGITVIAGENNSGKSTVSKSLFCIFNSFYNTSRKIRVDKRGAIYRDITGILDHIEREKAIEVSDKISGENVYLSSAVELRSYLKNTIFDNAQDTEIDNLSEKIMAILKISDQAIISNVAKGKINAVFDMQVGNLYPPISDSEISLQIRGKRARMIVKNNENVEIDGVLLDLNTQAIYIDNTYDMNKLRNMRPPRFRKLRESEIQNNLDSYMHELEQNAVEEIIAKHRLDNIMERINAVCPGKMVSEIGESADSVAYAEGEIGLKIKMRNVSAGLKTFIIIKILLLNNSLRENGTIILDEPEIHLHPEWQLVFAELIVLIQKEFNLHVLINTHSPYFLDAIDVYSHKHGVADKCRYYLSELSDNVAHISNVSDNIEKIYAKLARPMQVLENERYSE